MCLGPDLSPLSGSLLGMIKISVSHCNNSTYWHIGKQDDRIKLGDPYSNFNSGILLLNLEKHNTVVTAKLRRL